jgi:N6-adenosine-specific RNA methylase IME4
MTDVSDVRSEACATHGIRRCTICPRRYRTIVADPPWPIAWTGGAATRVNGRGERHVNHKFKADLPYQRMSIEAICALPVAELAEDDAHLYLWAPDRFLLDGSAARVAQAWGFKPGRLLIWAKTGFGLGRFPRPQHEAIVVCRRGTLTFRVDDVGSIQTWKMPYHKAGGRSGRTHSAKPDGSLDLIERASPGPYVELFARRARFGWDYWGDESLATAKLAFDEDRP